MADLNPPASFFFVAPLLITILMPKYMFSASFMLRSTVKMKDLINALRYYTMRYSGLTYAMNNYHMRVFVFLMTPFDIIFPYLNIYSDI